MYHTLPGAQLLCRGSCGISSGLLFGTLVPGSRCCHHKAPSEAPACQCYWFCCCIRRCRCCGTSVHRWCSRGSQGCPSSDALHHRSLGRYIDTLELPSQDAESPKNASESSGCCQWLWGLLGLFIDGREPASTIMQQPRKLAQKKGEFLYTWISRYFAHHDINQLHRLHE